MRLLLFISFSMIFGACQFDKVKPQSPDSMPNYDLVFNDNSLDEISISVVPNDWKALQDNLSLVIQNENVATEKLDKNLLTVPALVRFKGGVWNKVGLKYHNSFNLIEGFKLGEIILPLELDFDYYEDTFSEVKDQKFHGFSNLILHHQADDDSRIRQILQNKLLEALKINTTKNSLKKVKLSVGDQNQIVIFTLKEKIDSDLIKNRF
jgi:spore coat protein H